MKRCSLFLALALVLLISAAASAAQIRAYVAEFSVTGTANKDELKTTLQTLLASRLNGEKVVSVDSPTGADILVKGSYILFGKIFSIDVVAKDVAGRVISRAYQQGENQDELIPSLGKIGQALSSDIVAKSSPTASEPTKGTGSAAPRPAAPVDIVPRAAESSGSDIVKPQDLSREKGAGWISQRLGGALIGIAAGKTLTDGSQELYIADEHGLRLYRKGDALKLIAEVSFSPREKVLGIDSIDLDNDGVPEAYVTIMDGDTLSSQVWVSKDNALKRLAAKQPYYFRVIALDGATPRLYAQQMSTDRDFYGDVFEVVKKGDSYELTAPMKLPRFGTIYNFNRFKDAGGTPLYVVINEDGYLIVYTVAGEELWRSNDKYGGTESFFKREDLVNIKTTGDPNRWVYLEQRITVTPAGDILVPQNTGFFVLGNNRSYKKNSVYAFAWNGSSLDEKWHTKQSQNYLADYYYDVARKELLLLEVVKKEGLLAKGASMLAIKKVE